MAQLPDRVFWVLHALRCIGFTNEERIANAVGLAVGEVMSHLSRLVELGLVTEEYGVFGGWESPKGDVLRTTSGWPSSWTSREPGER